MNLPAGLLRELARDLGLGGLDPAEAVGVQYGAFPTADLVLDAWDTLREHWLARDRKALAGVVNELWRPGQANGYLRPTDYGEQLDWLRRRNNTPRLRSVVLSELIATGEQSDGVSSPHTPPKVGTAILTLGEQIFEVEGFQVIVVDDPSGQAPLERLAAYPFERAARGHWSVARWRQRRIWPNYPDLNVQVLDAHGQSVHGRTLLSTVRATYDREELALWPSETAGRTGTSVPTGCHPSDPRGVN